MRPRALRLGQLRLWQLHFAHSGLCRSVLLALFCLIAPFATSFAAGRPCIRPEEAAQWVDKDICIAAHVYDVVQLPNGTRYLDLCKSEVPDEECRFTVVSYRDDRAEVGELRRYRDTDVQIRGVIRAMGTRTGLILSHARQFRGGPPKFRPNPRLLHGFAADRSTPALNDPNLRQYGKGRSFMNPRN